MKNSKMYYFECKEEIKNNLSSENRVCSYLQLSNWYITYKSLLRVVHVPTKFYFSE